MAVDCPLFATFATSAGTFLRYGEVAAGGAVVENCRHGCRQGRARVDFAQIMDGKKEEQ